jgi:hypothetical protein
VLTAMKAASHLSKGWLAGCVRLAANQDLAVPGSLVSSAHSPLLEEGVVGCSVSGELLACAV